MASDRQAFSVIGFQYEPFRHNPNPVELYNNEDDDVAVPSVEESLDSFIGLATRDLENA